MNSCQSGQSFLDSYVYGRFTDPEKMVTRVIFLHHSVKQSTVQATGQATGRDPTATFVLMCCPFRPAWLRTTIHSISTDDWAICGHHNIIWLVVGLDKHLYFQQAIYSNMCPTLLAAISLQGLNSGCLSESLAFLSSVRLHAHAAELTALFGKSITCLFPVCTSFLLWQHRWVDSLTFASHGGTLWLTPPSG